MEKRIHKIFVLLVTAILLLLAFGFGGCDFLKNNKADVKVEGEIWTYYKLKGGDDGLALVSLNKPDSVLTADGELIIPEKIDGFKVARLGYWQWVYMTSNTGIQFPSVEKAQKVTIPKDVEIDDLFWEKCTSRIIEFLAETPDMINFNGTKNKKFIVPNGSRSVYEEKVKASSILSLTFVEKSQIEETGWYITNIGVLIGYFGLDKDDYVFPSGTKRISSSSFDVTNVPKTIVLNDGLEEIRDNAFLRSRFIVDEISIPQSVVSIGENACTSFNKVYIYRSTEVKSTSFHSEAEIIYLD